VIMDASYLLQFVLGIALVVFLVLLNGFFVAAEFAIVKIRDTQLFPLIKQGHRRAKVAQKIVQNLDASLSATQLGITLASLGLGWFAEPVFAHLLDPGMDWIGIESQRVRHSVSFTIGFSIITFAHIVAGELAPKSLAIQKPLPTSLAIARPLSWFYTVSFPFIYILNNTALWLLRRIGIEPVSEAELIHSEEELRLLLAATQKHSGASPFSREIVLNALDLRRRIARDVMRPRQEIVFLDSESGISECLDLAERTRYSRFPLCEDGDLDRTWGVVHFKDLFAMRTRARSGADLRTVTRKLIYIPETARLEKVLRLFLDRKLHMAMVVDEYGGTVGLVTLENILEELVGQIQDEFDQEKPLLQKIGEQTWEIAGNLPLHELSELVGEPLAAEGITTVNGWVTQYLGGFAKAGDMVPVADFQLRVEQTDGLRISRLRLTRAQAPAQPADAGADPAL
jgi:CBS domain containing-hemolysin-like protein